MIPTPTHTHTQHLNSWLALSPLRSSSTGPKATSNELCHRTMEQKESMSIGNPTVAVCKFKPTVSEDNKPTHSGVACSRGCDSLAPLFPFGCSLTTRASTSFSASSSFSRLPGALPKLFRKVSAGTRCRPPTFARTRFDLPEAPYTPHSPQIRTPVLSYSCCCERKKSVAYDAAA